MKRIVLPAVLILIIFLFSGCSSFKEGNDDEAIKEAIRICNERYGTEFILKKKAKYPKGVPCDVTVTSDDLPGKDIRIFRGTKLDPVNCDYIYQKYSDKAYDLIVDTLSGVVPAGSKIVPTEFNYNHFANQSYDADTTLEDYLQDNDLMIYVFVEEDLSRGLLRTTYRDCGRALLEAGIDCKELDIFTCGSGSDFKAIKVYDHIPELMEYQLPLDRIKGRAQSSNSDGLKESMEEFEKYDSVNIIVKE
ncbi:MAG: hypothetical protein K5888_01325 [Lachnospiraceae bacterium]|nr:hypothetical protein [Lachnospiraceae bacterium]